MRVRRNVATELESRAYIFNVLCANGSSAEHGEAGLHEAARGMDDERRV